MQVIPATAYEPISGGPATLRAAAPVATKIPAPMIAPTPRLVSWIGPSTRRSRFSPAISSSNWASDFLANNWLCISTLDSRLSALSCAGLYLASLAQPGQVGADTAFRVAAREQ